MIYKTLLISILSFNFLNFITAAFLFFDSSKESANKGKIVLSILTVISKTIILTSCLYIEYAKVDNTFVFTGVALLILSSFIFWSSIFVNNENRLSAAFSSDTPQHIVNRGVYKYVRHPFYLSYLLTYLGGFIGSQNLWAIIGFIIPLVIYWRATMYEEEKFMRSPLKKEYMDYKESTGRFLPKMIF